ncbi:Uncharacterized protein OBRU01_23150 [Operophtera brumata]|uniref:DDE Tnp4 domain-containing protein n=1 Tax=Operophtera brumata TaxID=104452 RepID=A0A0L7KN12_OPEBR|nr:Uncharacterized protein OBRU01_23150 [Operophtera brumata]
MQVLTAIRCWGRRKLTCHAHLCIRDIVARWLGSTHDYRIFNESTLNERFEAREFKGRLLGDSGYRLEPYLFTPVLRPHNQSEERYNEAQIATRNCVESYFCVWKQRFQCLLHGMPVKMENGKNTIDSDVEPNIEEPHDINEGSNHTRRRSSALLQAFITRHFSESN